MKSMVGVLKQVQRGAFPQLSDDRLQERKIRQRIAGALNEHHRDADVVQMRGALGARVAGRMQWKSQEHQSANPWQGAPSLRLRGHPATEGTSAGDERQIRRKPRGLGNRRTHRCMTQRSWIGASAALFHVWELVTKRGDAPFDKSRGRALHGRMHHPGTGPVREYQ